MTALRLLNLAVWGLLLLYMIPGAHHAITGKDVRRGDPMRLGVGVVSIVMVLGNIRWLAAPDNMNLLAAVHILALLAGLYIALLAKTYGRGPKL